MNPISKLGLLFYAALLLAPGALKSAHIFAEHQHVFCDHSSEDHIHQDSLECNLFSFQQHSFPTLDSKPLEFFTPEAESEVYSFNYIFLFDQPCDSIYLRGPPTVSLFSEA